MHFEGVRSFPLPVADVAARLSDAGFLAGCLPDARVTEATPDRAAWRQTPRLSVLAGSLDVALEAVVRDPGRAVEYRVLTKATGASGTVSTRLEFYPTEDGTAVAWAGDLVEVTGLLRMVPKRLIQSSAEGVIADVWAAVAAGLTG